MLVILFANESDAHVYTIFVLRKPGIRYTERSRFPEPICIASNRL